MLVVRYYCSYSGAFTFFFVKNYLCVSCYRLVQRLCRVVWLQRASQWFKGLRKCPFELISSPSEVERMVWTKNKHQFWFRNSRCTSRTPLDLCVSVGCYSLCCRGKANLTTTHSIYLNDGMSVSSSVVKRQHQQQKDAVPLDSEPAWLWVGQSSSRTILSCVLRLNYKVLCIVVLLLFTVIAHHLKAHSYIRISHRRRSVQWVYV